MAAGCCSLPAWGPQGPCCCRPRDTRLAPPLNVSPGKWEQLNIQNPRAGTGGSPRQDPSPSRPRAVAKRLPSPSPYGALSPLVTARLSLSHSMAGCTRALLYPPGLLPVARWPAVMACGGPVAAARGSAVSGGLRGPHTAPRADSPAWGAAAWLWLCWLDQRVCVGFPWQQGLGSPQPSQCNKVLSTGRVSVRAAGAPCRAQSRAGARHWARPGSRASGSREQSGTTVLEWGHGAWRLLGNGSEGLCRAQRLTRHRGLAGAGKWCPEALRGGGGGWSCAETPSGSQSHPGWSGC